MGIAALALLAVANGCANSDSTLVTTIPLPMVTQKPAAIPLPTATPEPTAIPKDWGRFDPWPMDGTCYRLENSLCVAVKSVDWDASANMPEVTIIGGSRSFGFTDRPPAGYKFVVVELHLFNTGNNEINTKPIWLGESYNLDDRLGGVDERLGVEVMRQGSNVSILDLNLNINPETGERDGCITLTIRKYLTLGAMAGMFTSHPVRICRGNSAL